MPCDIATFNGHAQAKPRTAWPWGATTIVNLQTSRGRTERGLDQRAISVTEHVRAVIRTNVMLLGRVADRDALRRDEGHRQCRLGIPVCCNRTA